MSMLLRRRQGRGKGLCPGSFPLLHVPPISCWCFLLWWDFSDSEQSREPWRGTACVTRQDFQALLTPSSVSGPALPAQVSRLLKFSQSACHTEKPALLKVNPTFLPYSLEEMQLGKGRKIFDTLSLFISKAAAILASHLWLHKPQTRRSGYLKNSAVFGCFSYTYVITLSKLMIWFLAYSQSCTTTTAS